MTPVHQVLPTFARGDAIGAHARRVQHLLREAGYESEIYAPDVQADARGLARTTDDFRPAPGTWVLYHFSIGSALLDDIRALDVQLAIDYHNITDAKYFRRWEPAAADRMDEGRSQLASIATETCFALAKSEYSNEDLRALGFAPTAVTPVLIDFSTYNRAPDVDLLAARRARRATGGAEWISVGRLAPNKCPHDVIAAFAAYRRCFDSRAHLTLVGDRHSAMQYTLACEQLTRDLDITDAVTFTGTLRHEELLAVYRTADVFVGCSEHEGFGVPALEAMYFDVPVVAYAAAATPEIVGDAGVLLDTKDPLVVATAAHEVLESAALQRALATAGHKRVADFDLSVTGPKFVETLHTLMNPH